VSIWPGTKLEAHSGRHGMRKKRDRQLSRRLNKGVEKMKSAHFTYRVRGLDFRNGRNKK